MDPGGPDRKPLRGFGGRLYGDGMNVHSGRSAAREKVLTSALGLFAQRGYFQTSMPDIQQHAGVSTGSIYRHFPSKDDIARAVYDTVLETIGAVFRDNLDGTGDFLDRRFRGLITDLFALTEEQPDIVEYALYVKHREISQEIGPICSSEPFVYLQARVAEAMKHGQLRQGDVLLTTATLMGPPLRLIQLSLDKHMPTPLAHQIDTLIDNARRTFGP
jgi:AcrR family transcriptional regulator